MRKVLYPPYLLQPLAYHQQKWLLQSKYSYKTQELKENGYQESIISKIFKRITNNYSLSQSKHKQKEQISTKRSEWV